jgi:hypothetical protein
LKNKGRGSAGIKQVIFLIPELLSGPGSRGWLDKRLNLLKVSGCAASLALFGALVLRFGVLLPARRTMPATLLLTQKKGCPEAAFFA